MSQRQALLLRALQAQQIPHPPVAEGGAVWLIEMPYNGFRLIHEEDARVLERLAATTGGFHQNNIVVIHPPAVGLEGHYYKEKASCFGVVRNGDSLFQLSLAKGKAQRLIRASSTTPSLAPLSNVVEDQLQAQAGAQAAQVLPEATEERLADMMLQPEMVPAEATNLPEEDIDLDEVCRLLQAQAPDAAAASTPVEETSALELLRTTALHGLPNFPNTPLHSMLRSVLTEIQRRSGPLPGSEEGRALSNTLLAAFTDCQQQQAATINRLYGTLSGRDATLGEKILQLVDAEKRRVVVALAHHLEPVYASYSLPSLQGPHIDSALVKHLAPSVGISGLQHANMDHAAQAQWTAAEISYLERLFCASFRSAAIVMALINDVNETNEFDEHHVDGYSPVTHASVTDFVNREIERMRAEGTSEEQIGMFTESVLYHEEEASYTQPPPQAMPDLDGYFLSPAAAAQIIEIALRRCQGNAAAP